MNYKPISGTRNANPERSETVGPNFARSGVEVGHQSSHLGSVGTGAKHPTGRGAQILGPNPSHRFGGQRSIGLFGIKTDRKPSTQAVKPEYQPRRDVVVFTPLSYKLPELEESDRLEREAEEAAARAATTLAMKRAAFGSDARAEREWYQAAREEQAESYSRFLAQWFPHAQSMMEGGVA